MNLVLKNGVIMNTAMLTSSQIVHRKVVCPACGVFHFQSWPEGWDAHAASRCEGFDSGTGEQRKEEFKRKFAYLFR